MKSFIASSAPTAAEIGRGFAPETVKDKEGWGRKLVRKFVGLGDLVRNDDGTVSLPRRHLRVAQELLQVIIGDGALPGPHDYKAPHANRGTPPRPHYSRYSRKPRAFRA
ncbi:hypothetical protein QO034_18900 [Sedimentitalea sp. JM2-8]|uniref:Uncharacterized protein n=1 Tax=Sedimentitalea xiamensis TaxID=3050037 RepID=A0ABT7FJ49_9RHOB|nr:hypothetical protein [Sedimentitalea xiamensis]MDK3075161.1 hypothetical protein [Sedimentitalea xiamensis]